MAEINETPRPTISLEDAIAQAKSGGLTQPIFEVFAFFSQEAASRLNNPGGDKRPRLKKFESELVRLCTEHAQDNIPRRFCQAADKTVVGYAKWAFVPGETGTRLTYFGTGSDKNRYVAQVY